MGSSPTRIMEGHSFKASCPERAVGWDSTANGLLSFQLGLAGSRSGSGRCPPMALVLAQPHTHTVISLRSSSL